MSDLVERFPTIQRLAAWTRGAISYQGPELVAEAVQCWHALEAAEREREATRTKTIRECFMAISTIKHWDKSSAKALDEVDAALRALPRDEPSAKEGL